MGVDGKRLDELARALGAGASRRRILKGLLAGIGFAGLRVTPSFAQDACFDDDDCESGFMCVDEVCMATCIAEGSECSDTLPCCANLICGSSYSCFAPCGAEGVSCEVSDNCCEGLSCDGFTGVCASALPCGSSGADCGDDAHCCDGFSCTDESICVEICSVENASCSSNDDCCEDLVCLHEGADGVCLPEDYCREVGEACGGDFQCCPRMTCIGDVCVTTSFSIPGSEPEPEAPVTSLPNTGAGGTSDRSGTIGATALISGAAALLAAKKLREQSDSGTA